MYEFSTSLTRFKSTISHPLIFIRHFLYQLLCLCYPPARWLSIPRFDTWETFCQVIGKPAWADAPELASLLNRKEKEEELDRLIEGWTINYTPEEIVSRLQANGIAAGIVEDGKDVLNNPQLNYRQHFVALNHPEIGQYMAEASPFKLSETPADLDYLALGEILSMCGLRFWGCPTRSLLSY